MASLKLTEPCFTMAMIVGEREKLVPDYMVALALPVLVSCQGYVRLHNCI